MFNIRMNEEKNGIEISFDSKPEKEILDMLKSKGFRWSKYQNIWYAKKTNERIELVNMLAGDGEKSASQLKPKNDEINLFELTRTENIPNHYENEKLYDNKEIAARIRKHLRARFPMCKWSVRSDLHSVDVKLISSPWEEESDEVKAIAEYAYRYTDSYNYDNSDAMSDYFDVNFYGTYSAAGIIAYNYVQREETVSENRISKKFHEDKAEFEAAERVRKEEAFKLRQIEIEKERQAYAERERIRKANHERVEQNVIVEDVEDYFILNLKESGSKNDSVKQYKEDTSFTETDARISRNIRMDRATYEIFSNQLLDDWSFLAGMGGSQTDDDRINSMTDYYHMTKEERDTVKWYSSNCVAIYVDDEFKMVIDPQGYDYARYCYFPDEETEFSGELEIVPHLSEEEKAENHRLAEILEDVSTNIIADNNLTGKWNNECEDEYKQHIFSWLDERQDFKFSVGVIREIEIEELKVEMYKLIGEYNGVRNQFKRAGLEYGDKFTLVKIDSWVGGLNIIHGIFNDYIPGKYAQYDDAVKLIYKPKNARKQYYMWLHGDVIVFRDWIEIPETVLWDITKNGAWTTKMSKFLSCDHKMYDAVLDYCKSAQIKPIINTYR